MEFGLCDLDCGNCWSFVVGFRLLDLDCWICAVGFGLLDLDMYTLISLYDSTYQLEHINHTGS